MKHFYGDAVINRTSTAHHVFKVTGLKYTLMWNEETLISLKASNKYCQRLSIWQTDDVLKSI